MNNSNYIIKTRSRPAKKRRYKTSRMPSLADRLKNNLLVLVVSIYIPILARGYGEYMQALDAIDYMVSLSIPEVQAKEPEPYIYQSDNHEVEDYIIQVFGVKEGKRAIKMLVKCENKTLNTYAVNVNKNGTTDRGIFQLNDGYHGGEENFDYRLNVDKAYQIYKRTNSFKAWTCAYIIGDCSYTGRCR